MVRVAVILMVLLVSPEPFARAAAGAELADLERLVEGGRWQEARQAVARELSQPGLTSQAREDLLFQEERMRRMRLDFSKTRDQVLAEARAILPDLDERLFARWERAGAVEFLTVDGQRCYFERAASNLFRVNAEARALKAKHREAESAAPPHRLENVRRILASYDRTGATVNSPRTFRVSYRLTVKPNAVPAGEIIRAWLPCPHAGGRQELVRWLTPAPAPEVVSPASAAAASVYLEQPALAGQPTTFRLSYEYTSRGCYQAIDPSRVRPASTNDPALGPFLAERPPHIVFDDQARALARQIVGRESNPYLRTRLLFQWVHEQIPWAGAREYSTLNSLPRYALEHRRGDCGIQTMLFMTLCRLNGIPARWVSGWTTGPDKNMHDWCEVYFDPCGWVPADVSYGLVASDDERERWFFLGGIDNERLVVNTDYAQPLFPAKCHLRSEIVDFQRGEVEWRGGNLYFDQWHYDFAAEELPCP
jgi:hypothetical protein